MKKYWDKELRVSIAVPYTDSMGKRYTLDRETRITDMDIWRNGGEWVAEIGNVRYKGAMDIQDATRQPAPTTHHVTAQCIERMSMNYNHFYPVKILSAN
jgi:hypothetical protein